MKETRRGSLSTAELCEPVNVKIVLRSETGEASVTADSGIA